MSKEISDLFGCHFSKKILKVITDPGEISLKSEIMYDKTLNATDPQTVGHIEWILKCTFT